MSGGRPCTKTIAVFLDNSALEYLQGM